MEGLSNTRKDNNSSLDAQCLFVKLAPYIYVINTLTFKNAAPESVATKATNRAFENGSSCILEETGSSGASPFVLDSAGLRGREISTSAFSQSTSTFSPVSSLVLTVTALRALPESGFIVRPFNPSTRAIELDQNKNNNDNDSKQLAGTNKIKINMENKRDTATEYFSAVSKLLSSLAAIAESLPSPVAFLWRRSLGLR